MAERLMRARLSADLGDRGRAVLVRSAGTDALVGRPMDEGAAACLARLGVDWRGFTARQLDAELVMAADLVITMTRQHRSTVVGMVPRALRTTFALREMARLVPLLPLADASASGPAARLAALTRQAWVHRGARPPIRTAEDDIADPLGQDTGRYRETAAAIAAGIDVLLGIARRGPVPRPSAPPAGGAALPVSTSGGSSGGQ
jgi:protein-tyrosine phosphatase